MARKSKYEEEKNRLIKVRDFLEESRKAAIKAQADASVHESYREAAIYKNFKEELERAIELCILTTEDGL